MVDWPSRIREVLAGTAPMHDKAQWLVPGRTLEQSRAFIEQFPKDPKLAAVLVNPGVAVPTAGVFKALAAPPLVPGAKQDDPIVADADLSEVVAAVAARRNDLEAPAISLQPVIADVLSALRAFPACCLARMSGSGATCFGLFNSAPDAEAAAHNLKTQQPGWWVQATAFG